MTLKDLIIKGGLTKEDLKKEVLFSNDEELNNLHAVGQIAYLEEVDKLVIYPLTGTEIDIMDEIEERKSK